MIIRCCYHYYYIGLHRSKSFKHSLIPQLSNHNNPIKYSFMSLLIPLLLPFHCVPFYHWAFHIVSEFMCFLFPIERSIHNISFLLSNFQLLTNTGIVIITFIIIVILFIIFNPRIYLYSSNTYSTVNNKQIPGSYNGNVRCKHFQFTVKHLQKKAILKQRRKSLSFV